MSKPPTFPHPSWTNNTFEIDEDIEDIGSYGPGGFHPVVLGDIFNDRYTVVHKLGSGGISTVWLVWDQSESQYVSLKIMRADQLETSKELRIHRHLTQLKINLEDNFICPLYDDFLHEGPNGTHICLVFPLAGDCVAEDIDLSLPHTREERTEQARRYGRQLAHAVALLHSVGIVHGGEYDFQ
ncbi:kinase-like protein [Cadophora sp. DSE1049]|nr:kinase-like protein [Cadophora sp. DSE1049]